MRRAALLLGLVVGGIAPVRAGDASMIFAADHQARMIVGRYVEKTGLWQDLEQFYAPPTPDALFTLFDARGKISDVRLQARNRTDPGWVPVSWSEPFAPRLPADRPLALGLEGTYPAPVRTAQAIAPDDADLKRMVSIYLKKRGLPVDSPLLTEAWAIDLDGDGQMERLVCAHNDASAVREGQRDFIYAVALLFAPGRRSADPPTPVVLASQTSIKPSEQSMDDYRRFNGTRDVYRFLALVDVDGDGRLEIAVHRASEDATQIDLWTYHNARVKNVLRAFKHHYN